MENMPPSRSRRRRLGPLRVILAVLTLVLVSLTIGRRPILDYVALHNYQPTSAVTALSADTTMTAAARHIFYVNHPLIQPKAAFNSACTTPEQTIVLGCYHSDQAGIYVYAVSDTRLQGVEQVTAAHEMLHAAYDRLSSSKRQQIDALLQDYYLHNLHDPRILSTIALYKKTEPLDVVNEMHSVFGTEVAKLPAALEAYYKQYFTDRSKVVAYANAYQAEFTSRENAVATDDQILKSQKSQIDTNEQDLTAQQALLQAQMARMNIERSTSSAAYNAEVPQYNAAVDAYNQLAQRTAALIVSYNQLVAERNLLALQVNQLAQAINSHTDTIQSTN